MHTCIHTYILRTYTHMSVNTHLGWGCQFWVVVCGVCGVFGACSVCSVYIVCGVCGWTRQDKTRTDADPDFWDFGARSAAESGGTGPFVLGIYQW